MFKICFALCILSYLVAICSSESVYCGKRSVGFNKVPWHVIVHSNDSSSESPDCGGTLLNELYVLTAAHCLFDLSGSEIAPVHLKVLIHRRNVTEQIAVENVFLPMEFNADSFEKDVAVLQLKSPNKFGDDVGPVCFTESSKLMTSELITIPIATESDIVQWKVTEQTLCHGTNSYIFGSSYNHSVCMGNILSTDKFQLNRGNGMVVERNGSWHLVGVLLYTTGPTENISTYGGGIDISAFSGWIKPIVKGHREPPISGTKCSHYNKIVRDPPYNLFMPVISIRGAASEDVCYGTLISERFILTAAVCGTKYLEGIYMRSHFLEKISFHYNYKFHFHPEDEHRQGIALIELGRDASNMEYFINCLWTDKNETFEFTTELIHGMHVQAYDRITVSYNPEQDVGMRFDERCKESKVASLYRPGDTLATPKHGEKVKRVVGVMHKQIDSCSPVTVVNVVNYLPWIEQVVWKNKNSVFLYV